MADDPQKQANDRADRAEAGMFLRRVLLKYGYDNLPDNSVSEFLMRLGPLGDIAMMPALDFLAGALTPRGTNAMRAGAAPDGTPLIELDDVAMRNAKNQAACRQNPRGATEKARFPGRPSVRLQKSQTES